MQLKIPPGSLSWLSALWIVLGAFVSYASFAEGDKYLGIVCLLFCVAGVLIWLDVREVALPLILWFNLVIIGAVLLLLFKGIALRPFTAILMACYTIYDLNQWRNSE